MHTASEGEETGAGRRLFVSLQYHACIQVGGHPPACIRREEGGEGLAQGLGRRLFERGGGVWNPQICLPKIAQINISFCKFNFFAL